MTAPRDVDQLFVTLLEEGRDELPDRAFDAVRAQIEHKRQRVVFGPWKETQMFRFAQFAIAAAAIALVAVVGIRLLPNTNGVAGPPTPTATATSPTPTASPTTGPTASSSATQTPTAAPSPSATASSDVDRARTVLTAYLDAINAGDYPAAWAMLAPSVQQTRTLADFTSERSAYHQSTGDRYTVVPNPPDSLSVDEWLPVSQEPNLDRSHAVVVEVDYPALAGNNAGYEVFVVGPIGSDWVIWPVR